MTKNKLLDQIGLQQSKGISKILNAISSITISEFFKEAINKKLLFHMPPSHDFANHLATPEICCIHILNIHSTSNLLCVHVLRINSRKSLI